MRREERRKKGGTEVAEALVGWATYTYCASRRDTDLLLQWAQARTQPAKAGPECQCDGYSQGLKLQTRSSKLHSFRKLS